MFLKHCGVVDLSITNMGSYSPVALAAALLVRALIFLPPEDFFPDG